MKKILSTLLKAGFVVALFVMLFRPHTFGLREDFFGGLTPAMIWERITAAATVDFTTLIFWLGAATLVKLCGIGSGIIRWKLLLGSQGVHLPWSYAAYNWFAGRALGLVTGASIGLDGWRLLSSGTYSKKWVECTTVIVTEKIIGFISLTFLVLITFPLGFHILKINLFVFALILLLLLAFTLFCFSILFRPRIIQVLVLTLPVPGKVRNLVNRIAVAASAYEGHRGTLLAAVFFGFIVHAATAVMYFCTMNAIRAENTSIYDVLFAAPLMIYSTVLVPTPGGLGVREIVFSRLLGAKSGFDVAAIFSNLGWWCGEFLPLCLSAPMLIFGGRPSRSELDAQIAEMRAHGVDSAQHGLHLSHEEVWDYRKKILATLVAGLFGGLLAGPIIGLGEAAWLQSTLQGLPEAWMYLWGAVVYGLVFAAVGAGVGAGMVYLYLLLGRFGNWQVGFSAGFAGTLLAGGAAIGLWRIQRDVYAAHAVPMEKMLQWVCYVGGAALIGFVLVHLLSGVVGRKVNHSPWKLGLAGLACFGLYAVAGSFMAAVFHPAPTGHAFKPTKQADGPNVILLTIDTLRADYLKAYNPAAVANTPHLDAFFQQGVIFRGSFSQSSWTKPSYATMFSGLYPEQHTATTKVAPLPENVHTLAEALREGGYYTAGFPNNPNVSEVFNFQQGFVEYNYLEPSLYFRATASSAKLTLYEVLRRVRQIGMKVGGKIVPSLGKMIVTDFYQPAEVVTEHALDWVDEHQAGEQKQTPFFLYLHYMDPHDPFMDPDSREGGYARVRMENPDPSLRDPMVKAYNREIEHLDKWLQPLFEGLKQRGVFDNTLIIFTSDHGEEFHEHGGWWHGQTLYDELCHVPLAIKLPGNALAGTVNTQMARHVDIAPTIIEFTHTEKPMEMSGKPLVTRDNALNNADITHSFASNDFEGNVLESVRTLDSKLIVSHTESKRNHPPVAVFNVQADPGETKNLADAPEEQPRRAALEQSLGEHRSYLQSGKITAPASSTAAPDAAPAGANESIKEQLKSLGYVGG